jgi:hypothetical protein
MTMHGHKNVRRLRTHMHMMRALQHCKAVRTGYASLVILPAGAQNCRKRLIFLTSQGGCI